MTKAAEAPLSTMARAVLPLAKPLPGMLFSSSNLFADEWLAGLGRGYATNSHVHLSPRGDHLMHKFDLVVNRVKVKPAKW